MTYITDYKGFVLWNDPPWEGFTKYPIVLKYRGHVVDQYETVQEAKLEIDNPPGWLTDFIDMVDESH